MCLCTRMLALEWKERAFIEKVNSRCFCWFPAAILVHQNGAPIWRLHTKLYKGAWNVSANNSETVGHKDLRLGQIVYILVFYNISFSWLLPLDGFQFIFLCRVYCVTVKTIYSYISREVKQKNLTPQLETATSTLCSSGGGSFFCWHLSIFCAVPRSRGFNGWLVMRQLCVANWWWVVILW